jgi:hypothetical protein
MTSTETLRTTTPAVPPRDLWRGLGVAAIGGVILTLTGAFETSTRLCDHPGCREDGKFRAPKSPDVLDDYFWFCRDHVREYNLKWNFFGTASEQEFLDQVEKDRVALFHPHEPIPAQCGVLLHHLELVGGELAGLAEDLFGYVDLADVVEGGGEGEALDGVFVDAGRFGERAGVQHDTPGVCGGGGVFHLQHADESFDDLW